MAINYEQAVQNLTEGISSQNFNQYAGTQGVSVNFNPDLNRLTVNNIPVDLNKSGLKLQDGQLMGTDQAYERLLAPFIQTQGLLNLEPYKTPNYLKEYINNIIEAQMKPFQYNVEEDPSAISARKQLEQSMAEMAGKRGFLYSGLQQDIVAQQFEKVAPVFEEASYQRHQDFLNRQLQLANVIMNWDQLQASNSRNEQELYQMKANFISQLDAREIGMFRTMLEQRRFEMEFALDEERLEMEKREFDMEQAWRRVNELGYADNETAIKLGISPGVEAGWVKKMIAEHQYQMSIMAEKHKYDMEMLTVNKQLEIELMEERERLQTESQLRLMESEYGFKTKLAEQAFEHRQELAAVREAEAQAKAEETARLRSEQEEKDAMMKIDYDYALSQFKYRFVESGIVPDDMLRDAINWLHEMYANGTISNPTYNKLKALYGLPAYQGSYISLSDSAKELQARMATPGLNPITHSLTDNEAVGMDIWTRYNMGKLGGLSSSGY